MLILGFLIVALIASLPNQVNAAYLYDKDGDYDDSLSIEVVEAKYLDYDNDGKEDDIITVFQVETPEDEWEEKGKINIACAIQKPSGLSIATQFSIITEDGAEITIVWFNWADEPGDYILYIKAEANSNDDDVGPAYIKHVFDPPGGRDDDYPTIAIMSIIEL
jgi:hypothetical protein